MGAPGACSREERVTVRWGDERALAAAAAAGNEAARRDLVELVLDRVRRASAFLAGPGRDPDDLAQDALVQILRSIGTFRGDCSLTWWADRVTAITAAKERGKQQRRRRIAEENPAPEVPDGPPGPESTAALVRVRERLAKLVARLNVERRTAVVLHHVQGYGVEEIAAMTGTRVNTVRDRLRVGRLQLRELVLDDPELRGHALSEEP